MSFLMSCPNCGDRNVNEFQYGGEVTSRPKPGGRLGPVDRLLLFPQEHCGGRTASGGTTVTAAESGSYAMRDTMNNQVSETYWP